MEEAAKSSPRCFISVVTIFTHRDLNENLLWPGPASIRPWPDHMYVSCNVQPSRPIIPDKESQKSWISLQPSPSS